MHPTIMNGALGDIWRSWMNMTTSFSNYFFAYPFQESLVIGFFCGLWQQCPSKCWLCSILRGWPIISDTSMLFHNLFAIDGWVNVILTIRVSRGIHSVTGNSLHLTALIDVDVLGALVLKCNVGIVLAIGDRKDAAEFDFMRGSGHRDHRCLQGGGARRRSWRRCNGFKRGS